MQSSRALFVFSAALLGTLAAHAAHPAHRDLDLGHANSALQSLNATLAANPNDAEAHNLRCRVYYQEQDWDKAAPDCEDAVRLAPDESSFHLWLGRAYGHKAEHASLMSSYQLARKVHTEFEQAVRLDPRNAAALADLGEFDVMAPIMVGGGYTRADAVVQQLDGVDPAAALTLRARIAESKKDYATAESDLKQAIRQSSDPANAWMDLASFYRRRGRLDDMAAAAHSGADADPHHGPALVDGATNLICAGREPQTAIAWLREYLNSNAQSELAPSFVARAQLAQLLQQQGDANGAQQQLALVHSLASGYRIPTGSAAPRAAGL
ncbi:MAG TPA: tetratricopeptide repeat protein [Acidobacteriaceae bacterium]|nr:tetratricopeptide repeat protein [Acidobacteriaceae bacterium]